MSLLDGKLDLPSLQADASRWLTSFCSGLWEDLIRRYTAIYNYIWFNPNGLTPQQVFDSLGTQAGALLTWAYGLYQYINTVQPGALDLPALKPLTINADGTVTVGA